MPPDVASILREIAGPQIRVRYDRKRLLALRYAEAFVVSRKRAAYSS